MSVLLGTDVPELGLLLKQDPSGLHTTDVEEVLVVTRAQAKTQTREEQLRVHAEKMSGVQATPVEPEPSSSLTDTPESSLEGGGDLANELFEEHPSRPKLTRQEKRRDRHARGLERAKDPKPAKVMGASPLGVTTETLKQMQDDDDTLAGVRKAANKPSSSFTRKNGLLYRQLRSARPWEEEPADQLVLPRGCREKVLGLAHSVPFGGHLGRKKTMRRVSQRFYWPTLAQDVAEFCRRCGPCQKCRPHRVPRAPMVPLPVVTDPFSRIAMDIVGPVPRSRSGNRYVLVICDYGTRYPEAVPLRSIDAATVAEQLMTLFSRVGIPNEILTDQGSNFQSQLLRELYRLLHIEALRTSPYHPQTDGLVERFNQTLKSMLQKTATEEGKDWDRLIPFLLFAYREVPQESTGFSPFEMLYGRDIRGPLDVLRESWEADERSDPNIVSYVLLMRDRLEKMSEEAQEILQERVAVRKRGTIGPREKDHSSRAKKFSFSFPPPRLSSQLSGRDPTKWLRPSGKLTIECVCRGGGRRQRSSM